MKDTPFRQGWLKRARDKKLAVLGLPESKRQIPFEIVLNL